MCRAKGAGKNTARNRRRESHELSFVGVDGEGVTRPDGRHDYVMLSVGSRTLWNGGYPLNLGSILSFLWECYQDDPEPVYVGFFLGYDFAQWFRQLPEREARFLFTSEGMEARTSSRKTRANPLPDPVVWNGFELDLMAERRFRLRKHSHQKSMFDDGCRNRTCGFRFQDSSVDEIARDSGRAGSSWLYVCDTGSFWQTSFVNVIKPDNWHGEPVCTVAEYDAIVAGKRDRGNVYAEGDVSYYGDMRMYNVLENEILARVTARLNAGFCNEQIPIRLKKHEWFGPGRAAQTWMDLIQKRIADPSAVVYNRKRDLAAERMNEKGILSADINMSVPSWFREAAQASYYGGWFEIFMHGHIGSVWEYDINSAYPHIISTLPCLHTDYPHTGRYSRGTGSGYPRGERSYTLLYGTFRGDDPFIGALPFRTRAGSVLRPHVTRGWYWAHEVDAAISAGLITTADVEDWCSYQACACTPPFNLDRVGIERMYFLRLAMGKNTAAGKAFKLVYNSAYGKTAQSIGSPKFASAVYASLITAGTRTRILEAIASHPRGSSGVAMVATDGVYFSERHPSLPLSKDALGAWDESFRENMTLLMPGVYWDEETRRQLLDGETPKLKSRGVAARDLAEQIVRLDHEFAVFHESLVARDSPPEAWPKIRFNVGFMMTSPRLALHRGDWGTAGTVNHMAERHLSSDPVSKRVNTPYISDGVIRTGVYDQWRTIDTTPYSRRFGWTDDTDSLISRDGDGILDETQRLLHD